MNTRSKWTACLWTAALVALVILGGCWRSFGNDLEPSCSQTGCEPGYRCVEGTGECLCDPQSCEGCCSRNQLRCLAGEDGNACGLGGGICQRCEASERCDDGQCVAQCRPTCDVAGEVRCAESTEGVEGYSLCEPLELDCLGWGELQPCPAGWFCNPDVPGFCSEQCANLCALGETRCALVDDDVSPAIESCGDFDDDECLELGDSQPCPTGQWCEGADSVVPYCTCDECPSEGARECLLEDDGSSSQLKTCNLVSGCLLWSYSSCLSGECDIVEGECTDPCPGGCEPADTICVEGQQVTCVESGMCGLWDYGNPQACRGGPCNDSTGRCPTSCAGGCELYETRCVGTTLTLCDGTSSGCWTWGTHAECPEGFVCNDGSVTCVPYCSPTEMCGADASICEGGVVQFCEDHGICAVWGEELACNDGICVEGSCEVDCPDHCDPESESVRCAGLVQEQRCEYSNLFGCDRWTFPTACPPGELCLEEACAPPRLSD